MFLKNQTALTRFCVDLFLGVDIYCEPVGRSVALRNTLRQRASLAALSVGYLGD